MKINYISKNSGYMIVLCILALICCFCTGKPIDLEQELSSIPGMEVKLLDETGDPFIESYRLMLSQPIDHDNPETGSFNQRMYLSHKGFDRPVVLITEGYGIGRNYIQELAEFLNANQLRVEYRFFGESSPKKKIWEYLNSHQSNLDYHRIVSFLKKIYKRKWISAGWSKGGQTALIYRRSYPDDVSVTVAYDSPINTDLEEPRIEIFFEQVETEYCRQSLIDFQRLVLENKQNILPYYIDFCEKKGFTFQKISHLKALEYTVLEYPFSFWQYHKLDCRTIPFSSSEPIEMLNHLKTVVNLGSYTDRAFDSISMKQFVTELGYYGYVTKYVKDLLSEEENAYPNKAFAPQDLDLTFQPEFMEDITTWLKTKGNNILYLYGENDPWSAPHLESTSGTNARIMWVKDGNHFSFIRTLSKEKQEMVLNLLEEWLDLACNREK